MTTQGDLRELEAERLQAKIARDKAEATKFRSESTLYRHQTELLKEEEKDIRSSLFEQRVYEFTGYVDEDSVGQAITSLSEMAARSKESITLRLWSEGGSIIDGLALYDHVIALRAEGLSVDTVVLGWAASMGGVLMQCGSKRYIGSSAHILIHEGRTTVPEERLTNLVDAVKFMEMLERRCLSILADRSTLDVAQMKRKMGSHDWWLSAQEAIDLGLADDYWPPMKRRRKNGQ